MNPSKNIALDKKAAAKESCHRKISPETDLGLLYSLQALANASAYRLSAVLTGTLLESSPSNFP
jgi:hypothetical protein